MPNSLTTLQRTLETLIPDAEPEVIVTLSTFPSSPRRLGVLDASFNPPTRAHCRLVELASAQFSLDHRLLLLAKSNVDKTVFGAPLSHRLHMMEILAQDLEHTSVGVTAHGRFVDKARALGQTFGPRTCLYFIVGFDTLRRLFDPKYYKDMPASLSELFSLAEIIYANRAGYDAKSCLDLINAPAAKPFQSRLHGIELEAPFTLMSSTEARRLLKDGDPAIDRLAPAAIREYLNRHAFYS